MEPAVANLVRRLSQRIRLKNSLSGGMMANQFVAARSLPGFLGGRQTVAAESQFAGEQIPPPAAGKRA